MTNKSKTFIATATTVIPNPGYKAMKYLYTLLFALSIILINPWGYNRGEIWTQPKIFAVILITILNISILLSRKSDITIDQNWKIRKLLWEMFLGMGLISTIFSPFPLRSLFGQNEMGDGWLYWLLMAIFNLSNTLLLKHYPAIGRFQLKGLLIGGVILAFSIFPQVINWKIDYTIASGQLLRDNILASTIFQTQQPIGLYSHRGHAAFVLAAVAVLAVVSWRKKWINSHNLAISIIAIGPALFLTQNRAAILALLVAITYLFGRKYYKLLIPVALIFLLSIGFNTTNRKIDNLPLLKQITSDRIYLWQLSVSGILQRPLIGWGFDGFGIAYPYVYSPNSTPRIVDIGDFTFDYVNEKGVVKRKPIASSKSHNLILDNSLSIGFLGVACYGVLFAFCLSSVTFSANRGLEAVFLAYLMFAFSWFECAQFTHLVWWLFSFSSEKDGKNRAYANMT